MSYEDLFVKPASSVKALWLPNTGIINFYTEDSFEDGRFEIVLTVTNYEIYFSRCCFSLSDLPIVKNRLFLSNRDTAEKIREYYLSLETES